MCVDILFIKEYDATELVKKYNGPALTVLVDQVRIPSLSLLDSLSSFLTYLVCLLLLLELYQKGTNDKFLQEQLKPEALEQASANTPVSIKLRMQPGYDHRYFLSHLHSHQNSQQQQQQQKYNNERWFRYIL